MNIYVMNLGNTIENENQASQQDRAEAKKKKNEYPTVKDSLTL